MVLAELWWSISRAIQHMSSASVIDEKALDECLNGISRALLQSDVQFMLVSDFLTNTRNIVNLEDQRQNKRKIIQQAILKGLCEIFGTAKPPFAPIKGKANVVMFVGLQGSGTTTACTKYAHYYSKNGWKPALLCADTFTAGAFEQLKQKAWNQNIQFFGSYMESDPVKIAVAGVERLKKEHRDVIIVDTGGRHEQEAAALFEEMRQVAEAIKPDLVILVMDSSIGQAAFDQAQAFKQSAEVGAVILTKMDGHSKGAGALSAIAATKIPVIFIGAGEHIDEFEVFDVKSFVTRLIDIRYLSGYKDKIREVVPTVQQSRLWQKLSDGNFTLRVMYTELQNMLQMGPISKVHAVFPGFNAELMRKGREKESQAKIKRYMALMDSMTNEELDSSTLTLMNDPRIMRIAATSGHLVREVIEMFEEYERLVKMWSKLKKKILARVN